MLLTDRTSLCKHLMLSALHRCTRSIEITTVHCCSITLQTHVNVNIFKLKTQINWRNSSTETIHRCCKTAQLTCLYDDSPPLTRNKLLCFNHYMLRLHTAVPQACIKKMTGESLVLLARKVVVVWISFPTEHCECLPHWRFLLCLLITTVRKYVVDAQEIILLQ